MKGSIRVLVGILVVFGAVSGIDNATDDQLVFPILLAICGLLCMFSGVSAMNRGIR